MAKQNIPSVNTLFSRVLLKELKKIRQWQAIAIKGDDIEGVHQVRVSLRKIRSALKMFAPLIQCKSMRKVEKQLKSFSKSLDQARDLDVYLSTNFDNINSPLYTLAMQSRTDAYRRVRKLLKGKKFNKVIRNFKKSLKKETWQKKLGKRHQTALYDPASDFAVQTLKELTDTIKTGEAITPATSNDTLHDIRIKFKKLRYGAEFFSLFFNKDDINNILLLIKSLQDNLGDIHDSYVIKALHERVIPDNERHALVESEAALIASRQNKVAERIKPELIHHYRQFLVFNYPWEQNLIKP